MPLQSQDYLKLFFKNSIFVVFDFSILHIHTTGHDQAQGGMVWKKLFSTWLSISSKNYFQIDFERLLVIFVFLFLTTTFPTIIITLNLIKRRRRNSPGSNTSKYSIIILQLIYALWVRASDRLLTIVTTYFIVFINSYWACSLSPLLGKEL